MTDFFADSPFDPISDVTRKDLTAYVSNEMYNHDTFSFSFNDFVVLVGDPGCESNYVMTYSVQAHPFLSFEDSLVPQFTIFSTDFNEIGTHIIEVSA